MVVVKAPPVVAAVLPDLGVTAALSNLKIRVVLAGKLAPLSVTSVPAAPEVADMVEIVAGLAVAVTVNVALAMLAPAVTVMLCAPAVAVAGMVTVLRKMPLARVAASPDAGGDVGAVKFKDQGGAGREVSATDYHGRTGCAGGGGQGVESGGGANGESGTGGSGARRTAIMWAPGVAVGGMVIVQETAPVAPVVNVEGMSWVVES